MAGNGSRHDFEMRRRALRERYQRSEPNKYARLLQRGGMILAMTYVVLMGVLACFGLIFGEQALEQAVGGPEVLYGFFGRLTLLLAGLAFGAFLTAGWLQHKEK